MRAAQVTTLDGPEAIRIVDIDEPAPTGDRVIVEVHAAGVAFPDALMSRGRYQHRPELPFVPGGGGRGRRAQRAGRGAGLKPATGSRA